MRVGISAIGIVTAALFTTAAVSAAAQPKKETDRSERDLAGPVRSVKISTEVLEAADKGDTSEGWTPSEIIFDKAGNIVTNVQFRQDGEVDDRTTTEIDKAGNKVKQFHYNPAGELKFTLVFDYDRDGRFIELRRIEPDGKVTTIFRSDRDRKGREDSIISFNGDGTINTTTQAVYDKAGERVGEISSTPESGVVSRVEYKHSKENGVTTSETMIFNGDGAVNSRYVETTDREGNESRLVYDAEGKLFEKQSWEYSKRDNHGNWTVEIMTKWELKDGELVLKLKNGQLRTIGYF